MVTETVVDGVTPRGAPMTPWDRLAELSVRAQTGGLPVVAWLVPETVLAWIIEDVRDLNPGAPIVYMGKPIIGSTGWGLLTEVAP